MDLCGNIKRFGEVANLRLHDSGNGKWEMCIRDRSGINAEFSWMTRTLSGLNKHIIFVAHRDTRKEGDDTVLSLPCVKSPTTPSLPNWICSAILK